MYIDAYHDRKKNVIKVIERSADGHRQFLDYPVEHLFYVDSPNGSAKTIFGDPVRKVTAETERDLDKKKSKIFFENLDLAKKNRRQKKIWESDINPVFRCLETHYLGATTPSPQIAYYDIESDFHPSKGFAPVTDPFNAVTAITVYLKWIDGLVTLALCPPTLTPEQAADLVADVANTQLYTSEKELLADFLMVIADADILVGYNSEAYDLPYLVNRIGMLLGPRALAQFSPWGLPPRERKMIKFNKEHQAYDIPGRPHLDYLALYQKHNPQQLHSYRLDYVGEIEVGENKVPYEGTLDDLYKKDFRKFVDYNRQDVMLLSKIDDKKKFLELANQIAHTNCVLFKTTMGSVALVEQAIIIEMHKLGMVAPDRKARPDEDDELVEEKTPVVGAYVADPKVGIHQHVGAIDINSLYPSVLRAMNASSDTIVGQFRPDRTMALVEARIKAGIERAEAWDGIFACLEYESMMSDSDEMITADFDDGQVLCKTGAQWRQHIFDPRNKLCISANGTLFRTDKEGVIPQLLATWYADRKAMQAKQAEYAQLAKGSYELPVALGEAVKGLWETATASEPTKPLRDLVKDGDAAAIAGLMSLYQLTLEGVTLKPLDGAAKTALEARSGFWNQRQQTRKILLNSLYGALLNESLRFYDSRIGQTTTLTGRSIVRHMTAKTNEIITGKYDYLGKSILYNDTDSVYFSAYEVLKDDPDYGDVDWTRETVIQLYDDIAEGVNESFASFMDRSFNTGMKNGGIIRGGRELVASTALFIKKKKYACLIYDLENARMDVDGKVGKLKVLGLDLKRSDTPKYMQAFLEKLLLDILTDATKVKMFDDIRAFREAYKSKPGWEKGMPRKVNAMSSFVDAQAKVNAMGVDQAFGEGQKGKVNMPGQVQAAINWNALCDLNGDRFSTKITDGTKLIVCDLMPNALGMKSVAYPIDQLFLPDWFKALPFDHQLMESKIIDQKINNLVEVLGWDLSMTHIGADDLFGGGTGRDLTETVKKKVKKKLVAQEEDGLF